jgi:prepilin-type N-terminal cleavage/methylation domain-containing protein
MRILKTGICNNGFTLLELIVVIFILSLGLAVAFPSFTFQKDAKLKSEAGRLASILRYLNDSAVSTKETFEMNLNFNNKLLRYRGPDGEKTEKIEHLSDMTLQSRGKLTDGEVTVFFSPTGPGENLTIFLTGPESSMAIGFNPLSGRVKVLECEGTGKK